MRTRVLVAVFALWSGVVSAQTQEKRIIPSSGAETTVLPAASDATSQSRNIFVMNSGTGTVTVQAAGGRVDAVASVSLAAGKSAEFISDGVDWWSLGRSTGGGGGPPDPHAASHENGGSDEISVAGLSGLLADSQTPLAHASSHQDAGADEIVVTGLLGVLGDTQKLSFMDEGVALAERRTVNFTGAGVSAADDAGNSRVNVTISGGAGSGLDLTTVEVDLGSLPLYSGTFDITGLSGLTANDPVLVTQAAGPYTGKGDRQDEAEMDLATATGYVVDANTIRVYWVCPHKNGPLVGNVKWNYAPG